MSTPKKILVYIDGTEESITAAQYAICLASYFKADLFALYVINTKAMEDLLKARIFLQDEQVEYEHDMEAWLEEKREWDEQNGIVAPLPEPAVPRFDPDWPTATIDQFRALLARMNGSGHNLTEGQLVRLLWENELNLPHESTVRRWLKEAQGG